METKPKSREELAREVELLKTKIQTLKAGTVRIEREAMAFGRRHQGESRSLRSMNAATHRARDHGTAYTKAYLAQASLVCGSEWQTQQRTACTSDDSGPSQRL